MARGPPPAPHSGDSRGWTAALLLFPALRSQVDAPESGGLGLSSKGSFPVRRSRCDLWLWPAPPGGHVWGDAGRGVGSGLAPRGSLVRCSCLGLAARAPVKVNRLSRCQGPGLRGRPAGQGRERCSGRIQTGTQDPALPLGIPVLHARSFLN